MGRVKFDIELSEEDLPRMFTDAGIDVSRVTELGENAVFSLLYSEAKILSLAAQVREPALRAESAQGEEARVNGLREQIKGYKAERDKVLASFRPAAPAEEAAGG
jgi:hypothetical protein